MSIQIEQDRNQAHLAWAFQSQSDIDSIRLVESKLVCLVAPEDAKFPLVMAVWHQSEDPSPSERVLTIPVKFAFKAFTESDKAEVLLITCKLAVAYALNDGYCPTPEQIEAFKQGNAVFNCWSYFREYVQSSVARMNYPPVAIPFLRMAPKATAGPPAETPKTIGGGEPNEVPDRKEGQTERKRRSRKRT